MVDLILRGPPIDQQAIFMLAFVEELFFIDAVLKHAVKKDAPDRLYIHALVDASIGLLAVTPDMLLYWHWLRTDL